jgi:beta-fructofuranosidase
MTQSRPVALRLDGHWLWDFWFARDGDDVHVFYLQAPRALGDPELRHTNATIGHAVSRDLRSWRVLPDALGAGAPGAFDDLATWTGSVLRHNGSWRMYYSGIARAEDGQVQRIGSAISEDLLTWEREDLLLEADPRWYDREQWRDPWVEWDAERERFDMVICATRGGRGLVGHATSPDGVTWTPGPPLSAPTRHSQLEVPQIAHVDGAWRILFCDVFAGSGVHYLTGPARLGPYPPETRDLFPGARPREHYAGKLLEHDGETWLLTWLMEDEHGAFVGELGDPMPLPRFA